MVPDPPSADVAVVGAGAWGTALALQAQRAGRRVVLWARDPARAAALAGARENPRLPGVALPAGIAVTAALPRADLVLLAVPMQHLRAVASALPEGGPLVCCAKGIEAGSLALPLEVLAEAQPGRPAAILTGPNFAREVAQGLPTAAVLAAASERLRRDAIAALATPGFRLYGNDDTAGAQVGGAAKNVVAIAAGAVIGAGLGENARAALVTRGLAELGRFAVALGGRSETVAGLSGLGDLLLTCTSAHSRNYSFGLALGGGARPAEILAGRSDVTEGVATAPALVTRAIRAGVAVPISAAVAAVLEERITLAQAIAALLARRLRDE
jgi:glycerol-3-phosphate dehydrogenase (NAD(P)+)